MEGNNSDTSILESSEKPIVSLQMPSGLMNMGNTCYLNTLLQCIIHSDYLREYFLNFYEKNKEELINVCPLLTDFGLLFHQMWNLQQTLAPKRFLHTMYRITPDYLSYGQQQDMNEMWCWIVDTLQKEHQALYEKISQKDTWSWSISNLSKYSVSPIGPEYYVDDQTKDFHRMCIESWEQFHKKDSLPWTLIHEGLQVQQICCKKCQKIYHNYEPFTSLTLEIPQDKESCHLADCFHSYLKTETLNQGEDLKQWKCDDCKNYTTAEKIVRFWKVPDCLVILLKRFSYTEHEYKKTNIAINIPRDFEFMMGTELLPMKKRMYSLKSIGNHYGSIQGGHYASVCLHKDNWWRMDDLHIEHIGDIHNTQWLNQNREAYVLFYERCKE